ncbi:MAG: HlyD family efflux transporter periplasmic adaptor subunit [Burkholderiaceae bacterium]|nr:HlyD family efflux transporter periplasmic adaptor subunit [Burkholderiaceae bacterium]
MRIRSIAAAGLLGVVAACGEPAPSRLQGYAEGEFVLVGAPSAGKLLTLRVERGQQVRVGQALFTLERIIEQGAAAEAQARVQAAESRLANLAAARRAPEIDALRQQVAAAQAALALSEATLRQQQRLFADGFVSVARRDEAQAARDRDAAQLAAAQAQLRSATQSVGRAQEIEAARAELDAARAAEAQARNRYDDKSLAAPADSLVADTYFRVGEWVPAGAPVVSLLPPQNIKLRFFVAEPQLGRVRVGDAVSATCDGCSAPIAARVSFVSPKAEYTPPVIYSRESRAKLVFLVEARPAAADATRLHPGQPVEIALGTP